MGSIGFLELLILLGFVVAFLLYRALFRGGGLRARLHRILERSAYREQQPEKPQSAPRLRWIPFPRAFATGVCAGVQYFAIVEFKLSAAGRAASPFDPAATGLVVFLAGAASALVGAFGWCRAVYLHFRPAHDRRLKYDWFLASACTSVYGSLFFYLLLITLASPGASDAAAVNPTLVVLVGLLLNPALWILAFCVSLEPWRRKLRRLPLGRLRRTLALVRRLAIPALFIFPHPMWLIYLWWRYSILERFSANPIVYLRSFRNTSTATAYGRIVAKAARSFGVVVAIVHEAQPGATLMRYTGLLDQPQVAHPADRAWHDWVLEQLARASVVLIDATVVTENVDWEIHAAISAVRPNRIAVLVERGAKVEIPSGVVKIEYALDNASVRKAEDELKRWFAQVVPANP